MFERISKQVIEGVNWTLVFYISFALAVVAFIKKYLEFDMAELIRVVGSEFREMARTKVTPHALNGMGIVAILLLIISFFFLERIRQTIEIAYNVAKTPHVSSAFEFVFALVVLALFVLLSAIFVRRR